MVAGAEKGEQRWLRARRRRSRGGGGAWRKSRGGRMRREGAGVAERFVLNFRWLYFHRA